MAVNSSVNAKRENQNTMNNLPNSETFAEHLNTDFTARTDEGKTFEIILVEAKTIISNKIQECFTLLFNAPPDAPPFQQSFQLKHDALGEVEIFLVPVKKNENGLFYEAVFNRLLL